MKRKFAAIILAALMVFGGMAATANAQDWYDYGTMRQQTINLIIARNKKRAYEARMKKKRSVKKTQKKIQQRRKTLSRLG